MTEAEWLTCEDLGPALMWLGVYKGGGADKRKARLLACACCRRLWTTPPNDAQELLALAERQADKGVGSKVKRQMLPAKRDRIRVILDRRMRAASLAAFQHDDLDILREAIETARDLIAWEAYDAHFEQLDPGVRESRRDVTGDEVVSRARAIESKAQMPLLHDIFGNPFLLVPFSTAWRTDTAVTLARQMYESRDFSAMPILADALQDAGCDSADVLAHCRDADQPHVRGCWVTDLVLGKE